MTTPRSSRDEAAFGRRRPRVTDAETETRMLRAATEELARTGVGVGLDHLRIEDLIRAADVGRSTVYRRWPHKDLFLADLLRHIVRGELPAAAPALAGAHATVAAILDTGTFGGARGRQQLLDEIVRRTAQADFQAIVDSSDWRLCLTLSLTVSTLPEGALRDEVAAALAESERAFTERIAATWAELVTVLGLRARDDEPEALDAFARTLNAVMRGAVVTAIAAPRLSAEPLARPVSGGRGRADWSVAALAVRAVLADFYQFDPELPWTAASLRRLREAVNGAGAAQA